MDESKGGRLDPHDRRKKGQPIPPKTLKVKIRRTTEGRLPESEFLRIVLDCLKAERELLGLDAAEQVNTAGQVIDWSELTSVVPDCLLPEAIEERIQTGLPTEPKG